jgi:hypothetical protein
LHASRRPILRQRRSGQVTLHMSQTMQ